MHDNLGIEIRLHQADKIQITQMTMGGAMNIDIAMMIETMMAGMKIKVTSQERAVLLMPQFPVSYQLQQTSVAGEGRAAGLTLGVLKRYLMEAHPIDSATDDHGNRHPHMAVNDDTRVRLK